MDAVNYYPIGQGWYLEYQYGVYYRHVYLPQGPQNNIPEWHSVAFGD